MLIGNKTMMRKILTGLFALAFAGMAGSAWAAPMFVNSEFDASLGGWTAFADPGPTNLSTYSGGLGVGGSTGLSLNGREFDRGTGVSQSVSGFTVGETYEVGIFVTNFEPFFGTTDQLNFGIFSVLAGEVTSTTASSDSLGLGNSPNSTIFGSLIHTFIADQTTIEFRFLSQLVDDRSFTIDNATLVQVNPIPLPAAFPLFAGGLGLLGLLGWRRKRITAA